MNASRQDRPTLWVAATPIGNLGDVSARLREILETADLIFAEDTRRTGSLIKECGLERSGALASLFEHNEEGRIKQALLALEQGKTLALVSDAGTPLLSDPGYRLVRAVREAGHPVRPIPGPSAMTAALSACGLPPYPFTFLGFPPRKRAKVEKLFAPWRDMGSTLVFFERKDRLGETLAAALAALGERECCIARELTKEYEEFLHGALSDFAGQDLELRGEITVVIGPPLEGSVTPEEDMLEMVQEELEAGIKPKLASKRVAERARGWTAKAVYEKISR